MRTERGSDVIIVLVGNKTDLVDKRYFIFHSTNFPLELIFFFFFWYGFLNFQLKPQLAQLTISLFILRICDQACLFIRQLNNILWLWCKKASIYRGRRSQSTGAWCDVYWDKCKSWVQHQGLFLFVWCLQVLSLTFVVVCNMLKISVVTVLILKTWYNGLLFWQELMLHPHFNFLSR